LLFKKHPKGEAADKEERNEREMIMNPKRSKIDLSEFIIQAEANRKI
jgi:hypothetical protein